MVRDQALDELCDASKDHRMARLTLDSNIYAEPDAEGRFLNGILFHLVRNAHGGSVATPIARYFTTRPAIGVEGYNPHWRVDCFVRDHELAPPEDQLARRLADVLIEQAIISEPVWIGWHRAHELGGEARGDVFEGDREPD